MQSPPPFDHRDWRDFQPREASTLQQLHALTTTWRTLVRIHEPLLLTLRAHVFTPPAVCMHVLGRQ